jgi:hypothetical protein
MHTIGDVIRMARHLLEHNPGTGKPTQRINGKECYCFWGAIYSSYNALIKDSEYFGAVYEASLFCGFPSGFVTEWEGSGSSDKKRLAIAKKLQTYVG